MLSLCLAHKRCSPSWRETHYEGTYYRTEAFLETREKQPEVMGFPLYMWRAGGPVWAKGKEGAVMRYTHTLDGLTKVHSGLHRLPKLELVARPLKGQPERKPRRQPAPLLLSGKAAGIVVGMGEIMGTDSAAMSNAQPLLLQLEGESCTESLTCAIKLFLKARGWGVRCRCGKPAAAGWARMPGWKHGGRMIFFHANERGRIVKHWSAGSVPRLELVDRPRKQYPRRRRQSAKDLTARKQHSETPMAQKVAAIFAAMDKIESTDSAAMQQAQSLLQQLEGELCTEPAIRTLKLFLRVRRWGVRCHCGQQAAVGWKWVESKGYSGRMIIIHSDHAQKTVTHQSLDIFPKLELVDRPRKKFKQRQRIETV